MSVGSIKYYKLVIHWLMNPVLTFALLFIEGLIISLIFQKLAECDEKLLISIRLQYCTTRMAG
jgi:hypothetical protein